MQSTIDFIIKKYPIRFKEVESLGVPQIVEKLDDKGNILQKYFIFEIDE